MEWDAVWEMGDGIGWDICHVEYGMRYIEVGHVMGHRVGYHWRHGVGCHVGHGVRCMGTQDIGIDPRRK